MILPSTPIMRLKTSFSLVEKPCFDERSNDLGGLGCCYPELNSDIVERRQRPFILGCNAEHGYPMPARSLRQLQYLRIVDCVVVEPQPAHQIMPIACI